MSKLEFKDLKFEEEKDKIKINFIRNYYFYLDKASLNKISDFKIKENIIEFKNISEKTARRKFDFLLLKGFNNLKNKLNNKKTVYIHQNSGIPLIGSIYFGLIERGTNLIEVRPLTGCNLNCIYCSVDEGKDSKKQIDFVVELDYLIKEFKKLASYKNCEIEAHINAQGEPLLYPKIIELVKELSSIKSVKIVSMDTNGALLTKNFVDKLAEAGLTRFNLSLNALDGKIAEKLAGMPYNVKKIIETAKYIPKKTDLIITPVWVPGFNDNEIPKLIEFAKSIGAGKKAPPIGIQSFLSYRFGRNPCKTMPFNLFYNKLKELEKRYNIKLIASEKEFGIKKIKPLPKPFKKREVTEAKIVCQGRLRNEKLAVAKDRVIAVPNCFKEGTIKTKITRTKHNIFIGQLL